MKKQSQSASARNIVCVDVGNTETSLGVFSPSLELCAHWTGTTPSALTADEAYLVLRSAFAAMEAKEQVAEGELAVGDAVLSSVVPQLTAAWVDALARFVSCRPLCVGPGVKTGIRMRYKDPAEVGADRIADIAAVLAEYQPPVVVVDMGTTTNFEVIDAEGAFIGGIIAPGMSLGARSLAREAAKLSDVEIAAPKRAIGTCTREAVQAGVVLGEIARIDGLLDAIGEETSTDYSVIVTGTQAQTVAPLLAHKATADETLTLRGLAYLHRLNRAKG